MPHHSTGVNYKINEDLIPSILALCHTAREHIGTLKWNEAIVNVISNTDAL